MRRKKRQYADDDGRTIVDMSQVSRGLTPGRWGAGRGGQDIGRGPEKPEQTERPPLSREERRMYALGSLKAALLIGLAYMVGLGLVIWLLLLVW